MFCFDFLAVVTELKKKTVYQSFGYIGKHEIHSFVFYIHRFTESLHTFCTQAT